MVTGGFIDLHTHLRDLGQKDKETIETGTKAAAAGGFTTVVSMANTEPAMDNAAILSLLLERIRECALVEVLPAAAVTKGLAGVELTNMVELACLGAVAFSDDGMPVENLAVLRRALKHVRLTGRPIISHAEDRNLSDQGVMNEGGKCSCLGLPGIPAAAETAAVAREIEVVRSAPAPYHFTHLSCAGSVELVRRAKADGLPVTADVTPHHLCFGVEDMPPYDTKWKMNPPLRTKADHLALIKGIEDGTIDAIATDHAPHTDLEKARTIYEAPFGITGLETAFSLTYSKLVMDAGLSHHRYFELLTTSPARILGRSKPALEVGARADLVVIDPGCRWVYDPLEGQSRSHNSPAKGELKGKVLATVSRGKLVFQCGTVKSGNAVTAT